MEALISSTIWSGRRVFVTGATGLVGSHLCHALLEANAYVVALVQDNDPGTMLFQSGDINRLHVITGQLEDYVTLERAINHHEIDTVFHLGAQTIVGTALRSPLPTLEANVRGTYNLLEACRQLPGLVKRVVVASSDKAYGESDVLPYTEDLPLKGQHPYDVSKSCTDLIAQMYAKTYRVPVAIARCGNIFGGGDLNWSRLIPGTIRSYLKQEAPVIRSDGTLVRDYIYVGDVVKAYACLAEALDDSRFVGEAFNFSNEQGLDVLAIVNAVRNVMGCEHIAPSVLNEARCEINAQILDASKAREQLNWAPCYNFEDALSETVAWYSKKLA